MIYQGILAIMGFALQLIVIRAFCKVLDMRSYTLYVGLYIFSYCLSFYLLSAGVPRIMNTLFINPLTNIVLPIALSRGPFRTRIIRVGIINLGGVLAETTGSLIYMIIGGRMYPEAFNQETFAGVATVYTLLLLIFSIVYEAIISICLRVDRQLDARIERPILVLMFASFLFVLGVIMRFDAMAATSFAASLITFLLSVATAAIVVGIIAIVREEAGEHRQAIHDLALARQVKHAQAEATASVRRAANLRKLRHDMANQIDVVRELANEGRLEDADRYLVALQVAAHEFAENADA